MKTLISNGVYGAQLTGEARRALELGRRGAALLALLSAFCSCGQLAETSTCRANELECAGVCVDLQTDVANCGACSRACESGLSCQNGECHASGCRPPNADYCAGGCVDTSSDPAHCGACDRACASDQLCVDGECLDHCSLGAPLQCGLRCANSRTNHDHCGGCDHPCAAEEKCSGGQCASSCGADTPHACGELCVDLQSNAKYCGTCNHTCGTSEVCVAGQCTDLCGGSKPLLCAGSCVDPRTDPRFCGGCETRCAPGKLCSDGVCQAECGANAPTLCSGLCVDPLWNHDFCGNCTTKCASNAVCSHGVCGTSCEDKAQCGNACVELATDPRHCGKCERACGSGERCEGGDCRPQGGTGSEGGSSGNSGGAGGDDGSGGSTGGQGAAGEGAGGAGGAASDGGAAGAGNGTDGTGGDSVAAGGSATGGGATAGGGTGGSPTAAVRGNGVVEAGEECDDGNISDGDGCSANAKVESGWTCSGARSVCVDKNECASNASLCATGEVCVNSPGSFSCVTPKITSIFARDDSTCALLNTGGVRCWGHGTSASGTRTPAQAPDLALGGAATQVLLGSGFSCALLARGAVRCWGQGYYGALGYANTSPVVDVAAAPDLEIGGMVTQIAKANTHSCALLSGGAVRCWGDGRWGELGYGNIANNANIGDDETPAAAGDVALGGVVTQIAVGNVHSCALFASGKVRCWGNGMWELLGTSSASDIGDDELPASAADVALGDVTVKQIVAGCVHTCALLTNGRVRCWGANTNQSTLGYGMPGYSAPSVDLPIVPLVKQLAAGCYHTCAVLVDGNVLCWGFNGSGQLGYGDKNDVGDNEPPSRELDLGGPVSQVATGGFHSCALLTDGSMRCWGRGAEGQLGSGSTANIGDDELPMAGGPVLWR